MSGQFTNIQPGLRRENIFRPGLMPQPAQRRPINAQAGTMIGAPALAHLAGGSAPAIKSVDPSDLIRKAQYKPLTIPAQLPAVSLGQRETTSVFSVLKSGMRKVAEFTRQHPIVSTAAASLGIGLTSSLAQASTLAETVSSVTGLGWSGLFWSSAALIGAIALRAIYHSNVQPNASAIGLATKRFFMPLCGLLTVGGALIYSTTWLAPMFGLPANGLMLGLGLTGAGVTGLRLLWAAVRGTGKRIFGYQRATQAESSLYERIKTTVLTMGAELGLAIYYGYRHTMTASLFLGVACQIAYSFYTLSVNPLGPVIGAGLGLIYAFAMRKPAVKQMNPLNHENKPLFDRRSIIGLAVKGALIGCFGGAADLWLLANAVQAAVFLALEDLALPHSLALQADARAVEKELPEVDTDQEIQRLTRSREAEFRAEIKVSANRENILFSLFTRILAGYGGKFSVHQINQGAFQGDSIRVLEWLGSNICGGARDMLRGAYDQIKPERDENGQITGYPVTHREALAALAGVYREIGTYLIDVASRGDFSELALTGLNDGTFVSPEADCETETLSKIIKTRGYLMHREAARFEAMATDQRCPLPPEALYTLALDTLDEQFRHFYPHLIFLPIFEFRNLFPYGAVQKIPSTDTYSFATKGFRSAIGIVRKDHLETRYLELIPTKVAKVISADYNSLDRWNIESNGPMEDNCYCWRETPVEEVTRDHYTDLAYIDNREHFRRHSTPILDRKGREIGRQPDLDYYPTGNVASVGTLAKEFTLDPPPSENGAPDYTRADYYDLVFKNGAVVRLYGDGHKELISGELIQDVIDSVVWVPGAEPSATLDNREAYRLNKDGGPSGNPFWYFFPQGKVTSLSDEEHAGMLVSDLTVRLKKDQKKPYLLVQREIPVDVLVPYDPAMKDAERDELRDIAQVMSWLLLRVATAPAEGQPGRKLWVPLNLTKTTIVGDGNLPVWQDIDETKGVTLIPDERETATFHIPTVTMKDGSPRELTAAQNILYYLDTIGPYQEQAEIDLGRGKDGPQPLVKFTFLRRDDSGKIVRKVRTIDYDAGKVAYKEEPIGDKEWEIEMQEPISPEQYHSRQEADRQVPHVVEQDGQRLVHYPDGREPLTYEAHMQRRDLLADETRYERFMPLREFVKFWLRGSVQ